MGQREEIMTVAYFVLARYGDAADAFLARKIEEAQFGRDGATLTRWLQVRQAARELLTPPR